MYGYAIINSDRAKEIYREYMRKTSPDINKFQMFYLRTGYFSEGG